jgi:hypothetical protein
VIDPEQVVRVVAHFQSGETLAGLRAVSGIWAVGVFSSHEVDVVSAGGEGFNVGGNAPDECGAGRVVSGVGPVSVDVEPLLRAATGEWGGVLRDSPEGAAYVVDVEAGSAPLLFFRPADQYA